MKKRIWILSMFPQYFDSFFEYGVIARAFGDQGNYAAHFVRIADYSPKDFKGVDDAPFGGGHGMVMRADVLERALIEGVVKAGGYNLDRMKNELKVIYPAPRGEKLSHEVVKRWAREFALLDSNRDMVFVCGRYEGVDERFLEKYVDAYISVGDYILSGGELATMLFLDATLRYVPGVLGNQNSALDESFEHDLLEAPLYTRPREFNGMLVPEEYLSGNPKFMQKRRKQDSLALTRKYRPDLI